MAEAFLRTQPDPESAAAALTTCLDEFIDSNVGRLANWELALIKSGGKRMISDWVLRGASEHQGSFWPTERAGARSEVSMDTPGVMN